jgi:hypothetical protein
VLGGRGWFELTHDACCYAGWWRGLQCPSRTANEAGLEGVVGKKAEAHNGVLWVVNEAYGDDEMA